jgi:uncharacterized damage-inducible protein DinB
MDALDQLWQYTVWANNTILTTLENYGQQTPASALRLMSHVMNAQTVWLARLNGQSPKVGIWDEHDLATCRSMNTESLEGFGELLGKPAQENISYKNSTGMAFENTVLDIWLQMLSHGSYHRGQIAMQLRQNGLEPVNTDYIIFLRTKHT